MQMPFEDERFDLVICSEVLEHLPSPEDALKELRRVSRGAVLLSVPWEPWFRLGNMLSLKNLSRLGNPPDHINHWTHSGFRRWLLSHRGGWSVRLWVSFPWTIALLRKAPDT